MVSYFRPISLYIGFKGEFDFENPFEITGFFEYGKKPFVGLHSSLGDNVSGRSGAMEDLRKHVDMKIFEKLKEDALPLINKII